MLSPSEAEPAATDKPGDAIGALPTAARVGEASRESVERLVQAELVRLACLRGKAERNWGKRSRAALRRFTSRAKPKSARAPDAEMLRLLRAYPANYCKSCNPGQAACDVEVTGALPAHSNNAVAASDATTPAPAVAHSYLPPWIAQSDGANAADEEVGRESLLPTGPVTITAPAPEARKPKRRKGISSRASRRAGSPRRAPRRAWPALSGWPGGR